ncbi:MAG: SusD/RagB family nutrient-binding outer membrane lipoprotein [Prolixibacteraceae bacterium]|jgi:hypothetical protein
MRNKIILSIIFLLGILSSCTNNFEELNTDTKHPREVTGAVLFTNAQIDLSNQISSTNVNSNIWKLMAQYWTERSYRDEANYDIVNRRISDDMFETYYAILKNLKDAKEIIEAEELAEPNLASKEANQANRLAIIELLNVFVYQEIVDIFGNIPYSEALNSSNYTPVYDDAQTIYTDLIARAKAAVTTLDDTEGSFDTADLIYRGDVASWKLFGNSLLVKLGIGIADGPLSALGKSTVEAAYANTFEELAEGAYFPYQESLPYVNPLYTDLVESGRHDFVMVSGMVNLMTDMSDPRLDNYFENLSGVLTDYGASGGSYGNKVHYNSAIAEPNFHGILLTYDEIQFYLAEAAGRGWNVGLSAEEYFNNGVKASVIEWGGTSTEADDFLSAHSYSSYGSWKEAVGTQAWVAMYTRGFIGYTFYRRLDYPTVLVMPPNPPTGVDEIPTRFTYPVNEQTLNAANYAAASAAIGGDKLTTRLFWDIN